MTTITRTTIHRTMRPTVIVQTVSTVAGFETMSWEFDGTTRTDMPVTFRGESHTIEGAMICHARVVVEMYREG